ncbi:DMT family transporter [Zwartia sp.]|uniref:DMT family transporter n=1 Tax=Zwartia sp. TaxID=2978004 RepID=UPI00271D0684|nr:DMT family transporter [Zwartia sp.]MDO9023582.1 DMT family transporter [Zwartia sp.]
MRRIDVYVLLLLAAIWGSSFLFIRLAVGDFGPIALSGMRTLIAGVALVPLLLWRNKIAMIRTYWRSIIIVGIFNSALPFIFFNFATMTLPAGTMSIINALTPLWGAAIAWVWLKDTLPPLRMLGLMVGFAGILVLVWDKLSFNDTASTYAVIAGVAAPIFYGIAASYTKKYLMDADPIATAAGSLIAAGVVLLPFTLYTWPTEPISGSAWAALVGLGLLCTAIAYVLYYRLLIRVGPPRAMTVTFLIPVFGVLWGWLFLDESITLRIVLGGGVILLGTALATGFVGGRKKA